MHVFAPEVGILGTVPLVAATIPLAVGAGLASKLRGDQRVSVSFFGDGAAEEGHFHESLNLRPLFAHLDRQIAASNGPEKAAYATRLSQVAREIINRQLVLLEQVGSKLGRTVDVDKFRASPGGSRVRAREAASEYHRKRIHALGDRVQP